MAGNKYIKTGDVERIILLIRGWPDRKIEWEAVCVACESILGYIPSRQGLSAHKSVQAAFRARKECSEPVDRQTPAYPSSLKIASQRIAYLNSVIQTQNKEIDNFRSLVTIWQYNAYKRGLSASQLNEPLPMIDRERSVP